MKFNTKEIREKAAKDFEKAWIESPSLFKAQKSVFGKLRSLKGEPHPVYEIIQKLRQSFLGLGFKEVIVPVILEDEHVFKQYGPEAAVILDRCYYLAALPRPDIGLSEAKLKAIQKIVPGFNDSKGLQEVLRNYKKGSIEGDDFVEEMCKLGLKPEQVTKLLDEVFPEFKSLKPVPSNMTLRSHMTTSWFPVLASMVNEPKPLALFTTGLRFRREQKEDMGHLRAHHGASCVVMDPEVSLKDGEELVMNILAPLGFKEFKFVTKKATSKYYTPGMEVEAYAKLGNEWLEIADFGLYSPLALANYGIEYPVMNLGIGVERIGMIIHKVNDIRILEYPHLHKLELGDSQIASMINFIEEPKTQVGKEVAEAVYHGAIKHANEIGLCAFPVWEGEIAGKKLKVEVYEHDKGAKLMHPGALNKIWVKDGNISGLPDNGFEEMKKGGIDTGIDYLRAIASMVGARVEKGEKFDLQIKVVKQPSDINLGVDESAWFYITSKNKKIDVRGPVFLDIRVT